MFGMVTALIVEDAMNDRIIVGYDGSRSSYAAVEWAAREAVVRDAQLNILSRVASAADVRSGCADAIRGSAPAAVIRTSSARRPRSSAHRVKALVEASAAADSLVVGKTGAA